MKKAELEALLVEKDLEISDLRAKLSMLQVELSNKNNIIEPQPVTRQEPIRIINKKPAMGKRKII
jgi:hypothetical protein